MISAHHEIVLERIILLRELGAVEDANVLADALHGMAKPRLRLIVAGAPKTVDKACPCQGLPCVTGGACPDGYTGRPADLVAMGR